MEYAGQVVSITPVVDVHGAEDVALAMAHDLERSQAILDTVIGLLQKVLGFMVIGQC